MHMGMYEMFPDGETMTNKEIAGKIFYDMLDGIEPDYISIAEQRIEQAVNEAEKRGYEKYRSEAMENGKAIIKEAQKIAAEQMRERAAQEMDNVLDLRMDELVASKRQIRSLPLTEQEGTNVPLDGEVKPWCQHDDPSWCTDACRKRGE